MKIWGIGANWNKSEKDNFINHSVAAIGYSEDEAPALHAMMSEMEIGDIIYIKSFIPKNSTLKIKAVGRIIGYPYTEAKIFGNNAPKRSVPVKWVYSGDTEKYELTPADTKYNVYSLTLYREYSPGVIKKLNNLIDF